MSDASPSSLQPYFNTVERVLQLDNIADSWRGTSFMPNAAIKGAGVSCQKLVTSIYIECGALPADFICDDGPMNWARAQKESLIEKFMEDYCFGNPESDKPKYFERNSFPARYPQPGDMLGFRVDGCVHHCGVMLGAGRFIHCWRQSGVMFSQLHDAAYLSRLAKIWRPFSLNPEPSTPFAPGHACPGGES
jgi:cell wall-associated NlpC family hydrolase